MTDMAKAKADCRKAAFAARKGAFVVRLELAGCDRLATLISAFDPRIIAGYMPIRTEIDPTPVMERLHQAGRRICVPVITGEGQPLAFREWTPGCALQDGPFGAKVPITGDWLDPEVLICPLVAFDARGYRLGYGGGFYDRSLAQLAARGGPAVAVGFGFDAQEAPAVPTEPTDIPLDAMVTDLRTLAFSQRAMDAAAQAK